MERQFNNGDFEKLLRDNANQYRMYPSEKVWKGIHSALHTRRRWYGFTAAIMLLITGSFVSIIIYNNKPGKNISTHQRSVLVQNSDQQHIPTSVSNEIRSFTPAINETKPISSRIGDITNTFLNDPVFEKAPADEKEINEVLNNRLNNPIYQPAIEAIVPDKSEMTIEFPLYPDPTLLKQNTPVKTEAVISGSVTNEKSIADQSALDETTEKKITDAVSVLTLQNLLLPKQQKRSKITAQVYFTPTVSYRKLTENKKVYSGSGFYVPTIDVNNLVKHKPAMGLEFGIEGRYQVNGKFSLKTGLQFNINRYDIRAYSHPTEIATVALTSGFGYVDSLATLSNYRNFNGTSANWLENFYFQVAIPVGGEYILSDKKNIQWGISGTIQPTYTIGDRAYVISSDYKNYAKFPDLMRRWNISTGVETFVSYSTGKIKWQVGPHVRYQHLSSFVSALTVKENLFAIGLKVGATLNNKK